MICAKTAEPIEMLFGMWTWVGPRKHVLDGGHIDATWWYSWWSLVRLLWQHVTLLRLLIC